MVKRDDADSQPKSIVQGMNKDQLIKALQACNNARDNYKVNAKLTKEEIQERIDRYNNRYIKPDHDELNSYPP